MRCTLTHLCAHQLSVQLTLRRSIIVRGVPNNEYGGGPGGPGTGFCSRGGGFSGNRRSGKPQQLLRLKNRPRDYKNQCQDHQDHPCTVIRRLRVHCVYMFYGGGSRPDGVRTWSRLFHTESCHFHMFLNVNPTFKFKKVKSFFNFALVFSIFPPWL